MGRVCRSLTFDAAVPIEVASTAPLRRHTDLVLAGRIGAGFGRPVLLFRTRWAESPKAIGTDVEFPIAHRILEAAIDADVPHAFLAPADRSGKLGSKLLWKNCIVRRATSDDALFRIVVACSTKVQTTVVTRAKMRRPGGFGVERTR